MIRVFFKFQEGILDAIKLESIDQQGFHTD